MGFRGTGCFVQQSIAIRRRKQECQTFEAACSSGRATAGCSLATFPRPDRLGGGGSTTGKMVDLTEITTEQLVAEMQRRLNCQTKPEKHVVLAGVPQTRLFWPDLCLLFGSFSGTRQPCSTSADVGAASPNVLTETQMDSEKYIVPYQLAMREPQMLLYSNRAYMPSAGSALTSSRSMLRYSCQPVLASFTCICIFARPTQNGP